ncbi:MAG TPA: HAMP domain-containing histidine kinase [Sulfurimonas sp.]|nr:HAMP domain-containing histidine kinase [Sulfurimonas sp.]
MLSYQKSIRSRFLFQLLVASAALIFIFSSILYLYIQQSIYDDKKEELLRVAKHVVAYESIQSVSDSTDGILGLNIEMYSDENYDGGIELIETKDGHNFYLSLLYPFNLQEHSYIKVTEKISNTKKLLANILNSIFIINIAGFVIIIIYAVTLSTMLIKPINVLTKRLSNMNEHLIRPIKIEQLPIEFLTLGETLNHLIARLQNFVKYQKELFIGTAHELKTPLAVMKLKNQVTLIKKRESQEYIDAIKINNKTIDEMNKIIADILNIGRQEGAQLETPKEVDVITYLRNKGNDFKLLAENEGKELQMDFRPDLFMATLQTTLLNQIVQNFLQNALKFTQSEKIVLLKSFQTDRGLCIQVIDEGVGVDESFDHFAPFKRSGNKGGVGLGLFLAQSAADALNAKITIINRTDGVQGAVASLELCSALSCVLPSTK